MKSLNTFYLNARYFIVFYLPFILLADAPQIIADSLGAHTMVGEVLSNISHIALFILAYYVSRQPKYVAAIGITYIIANIATIFETPIANFIVQLNFTACLLLLIKKFYVARHQTAAEVFERMSRA